MPCNPHEDRTLKFKLANCALQFHGQGLPVRILANSFDQAPCVIRGCKRKLITDWDTDEAEYTYFNFESNDDYLSSIRRALKEYSNLIAMNGIVAGVEQVTLHLPIYGELCILLDFPNDIICEMLRLRLVVWLDFYYEAEDWVPPPDAVTKNAPPGTVWFGGLVDRAAVLPLQRELDYEAGAALKLFLSHYHQLQSNTNLLPGLAALAPLLISRGKSQDRIGYFLEAYRSNGSYELSLDELRLIAQSNAPLTVIAAHRSWFNFTTDSDFQLDKE